jgi:hypothetical protein
LLARFRPAFHEEDVIRVPAGAQPVTIWAG